MEGIAGNAEFFNILGAKLSGSEAFILLLIVIVIFAVLAMAGLLLKNGGLIKNILLSREETAVKRESKEKDQDHEIEKLKIHQKNHDDAHEHYGLSYKELDGRVKHVESTMVTKDEFSKMNDCLQKMAQDTAEIKGYMRAKSE